MENQDIIDDQGGGLTESENQAAEKPAFSEDQQALIDGIIEKRLARQNQKHQAELEAERLKREELEKKMNPGDENLELPHGRGLVLIRAYMDEVTFTEKGNCITMRKKAPWTT